MTLVCNLSVRVVGHAEVDFTLTRNDQEFLVLRVVPVLSLGNTRLGDIDANLSALHRMQRLRETSAIVTVHCEGIAKLVLR